MWGLLNWAERKDNYRGGRIDVAEIAVETPRSGVDFA
jgi:hypothetical protein